jgi:HlyD family secretion protein
MKRWMLVPLLFVVALSLAACSALGGGVSTTIKASGTISADTVKVAPEVGGKLAAIKVQKGDAVKAGDLLFQLDDALTQAQIKQADAAVKVAQANLDAANVKQSNAQAQFDQANQAARIQDQANHATIWQTAQDSKIVLPPWYFVKSEQISALQAQLDTATKNLSDEQSNLDKTLKDASNKDFVTAEKNLLEAQKTYTIAAQTLDEAKAAKDNKDLQDAAQKSLDAAQADLDSAQKSYDQMLSSDAATHVREARARLAVANEQVMNTQDALDKLSTGSDSIQVQVARTALDQAKSGVAQAQASLIQAQAALDASNVQLKKLTVNAPTAGIVLSRPVNAGEVTAAGATVLEVGALDTVTLTVYIPESQYGQIQLGQSANVTTDSFPGKTFTGKVTFIADQAEFTPRNVQTVESRSTTVYKVEISLSNANLALKPGMPADASFVPGFE